MVSTDRITLRRGVLVVAVLAGMLATWALTAASAAGQSSRPGRVYHLRVTTQVAGQTVVTSEWVNPSTGAWRLGLSDGVELYNGRAYARFGNIGTRYVRLGSARFLGPLANPSGGLSTLRASLASHAAAAGVTRTISGGHVVLTQRLGGVVRRVAILDSTPSSSVSARALFAVSLRRATDIDRELRPGRVGRLAPTAYWFGSRFGARVVSGTVEHWRTRSAAERRAGASARADAAAYIAVYDRPQAAAAALTPGAPAAADELQVVTLARGSVLARAHIATLNGNDGTPEPSARWPRFAATLADGEAATVVPFRYDIGEHGQFGFYVVTRTALIAVIGHVRPAQIGAIAARLRPVA